MLDWWPPYRKLKELLGPDPVEGPRVEDLRVTTAAEGSPRNFVVGSAARVNTTLMWASALKEVKESHEGGKGGFSAEYVEYKYYLDCAYAICDGPVKEVNRIWLDGKTVYGKNTAVDLPGSYGWGDGKEEQPYVGYWVVYQRLHIETNGDPNLSDDLNLIQPGQKIKLSNFVWPSTAPYNAYANSASQMAHFEAEHEVAKVYESNSAGSGGYGWKLVWVKMWEGTTAEKDALEAQFISEGGVGTLYWGDGNASDDYPASKVTYDLFQAIALFNAKVVQKVVVRLGGDKQMPSGLISAYEDPPVPAFRGTCYVTFQNMLLTDFGNRPPVVEALVNSGKGTTVASAIRRICVDYAGLPTSRVKVHSSVTGTFYGMNIEGNVAPPEALLPIMAVYNLIAYDDAGVLTFRSRLDPQTRTITRRIENGVEFTQVANKDLPGTLVVEFIDPSKGYQQASRRARTVDVGNNVTEKLSLPIVITGEMASETAHRLLWDAKLSMRTATIKLPPSELVTRPADMITIETHDTSFDMSVMDVDFGADMTVQANVKEEDLEVLDQSYVAIDDEPAFDLETEGDSFYTDLISWTVLDIGPLMDEHVDACGIYFAACSTNRRFKGAAIYMSADNQRTFTRIGRVETEAVIGVITAKSGDYSGNSIGLDSTSTFTVELISRGELESIGTETMLAGGNTFCAHGEVFGAATCELVAENTYQLSNMARGLRGTENAVDTQEVGDYIVLLERRKLHYQPMNPAGIRTKRWYKLVPPGGVPELIDARPLTFDGGTLRTLSPYNLRGKRDASNNLTISWLPRAYEISRLAQGRRRRQEKYILRTHDNEWIVEGTREFVYTAAQQTAEGITPGNVVSITVYQVSDIVGRSYPRTAVL